MFPLWYICEKWSKTEDANVDICCLTHSFGGSACVCLYVRGACICAHDSACLSGSSKALSGALCGPRSLPFQPPFFCLSVSYLIELAQKQSKYRYLRLRTKPHWCLVEVSPLSVYITARILSRVSMSCTSKDIIHNDVPHSLRTAWSLRSPSLSVNIHTCPLSHRCLDW